MSTILVIAALFVGFGLGWYHRKMKTPVIFVPATEVKKALALTFWRVDKEKNELVLQTGGKEYGIDLHNLDRILSGDKITDID